MSSTDRSAVKSGRTGAVRLLVVIGCTAMLAGCYTDRAAVQDIPNDARQRHPIAIREGVHTVELFIGSKRGELTVNQRGDVIAFAHTWRRDAAGGVMIDLPSGTSNEAAAAGALQEVRSILTNMGIPAQDIEVHPYQPKDPRTLATLRLNYPRMVASAGPCGMWPHDTGPTIDREHSENREYWNFGCASQRNFAAQVDNPSDLVQPRGEGPTYTPRRTMVFEQYRRGVESATVYVNPDKGKISDIGAK
ncbi:MAG: pilus assembly protein CpaD [Alphaproteobacteria bacterium]|jgi:pilus assembly protein CpaD|nr:pilus assembly protein CpaD [Alphaproteobacteria bacterium]